MAAAPWPVSAETSELLLESRDGRERGQSDDGRTEARYNFPVKEQERTGRGDLHTQARTRTLARKHAPTIINPISSSPLSPSERTLSFPNCNTSSGRSSVDREKRGGGGALICTSKNVRMSVRVRVRRRRMRRFAQIRSISLKVRSRMHLHSTSFRSSLPPLSVARAVGRSAGRALDGDVKASDAHGMT